jgi:hypothetical protein
MDIPLWSRLKRGAEYDNHDESSGECTGKRHCNGIDNLESSVLDTPFDVSSSSPFDTVTTDHAMINAWQDPPSWDDAPMPSQVLDYNTVLASQWSTNDSWRHRAPRPVRPGRHAADGAQRLFWNGRFDGGVLVNGL